MKNVKKVIIIDYQLSNLFSVKHACNFIGLNSIISSAPEDLLEADAAILPGVGAFGEAMRNLNKLELILPIKKFIESGRPFMGICLGFQLLFSQSEEFGKHKGLGLIEGVVTRFPNKNNNNEIIKVPQIGWNKIYLPKTNTRWKGGPLDKIKNNEYMYFIHSYFAKPINNKFIFSSTNYGGIEYCSSISYNNIFATQFHPEKSGKEGIRIYKNWSKLIK